jgi:DNA-binding FadR family transcriptional regulator
VQAHRQILDCIRNGDSSGAQRAMRNHLRNTARDLRAAANLVTGVPE